MKIFFTFLFLLATQVSLAADNEPQFEFIRISPYYKNKTALAKMTGQLMTTESGTVISTITGQLGDCQECTRGATIKSKIGIRFYGDSLADLTISRKQSTSIKIKTCPQKIKLIDNKYECEFAHSGTNYKIILTFESI